MAESDGLAKPLPTSNSLHPTTHRFTTACPCNCYSTCSMRVQVENGRIRRIEPHPDNRATPGGACLKGLSYVDRVHAPDRILHSLRRKATGSGFERISWDEALDAIESEEANRREGGGRRATRRPGRLLESDG